jgi:hypothetical protein
VSAEFHADGSKFPALKGERLCSLLNSFLLLPFLDYGEILGGSMENNPRDWQQIAADLRSETNSEKMLSLALELEGALEKDGRGQADDSMQSPRTPARAKLEGFVRRVPQRRYCGLRDKA